MSQLTFSPEWIDQFTDPYAVLGLSVAADDRRVLKRYRAVAKLLHPDGQMAARANVQQLASQLLARLVNPAYQKLKQEKERSETLATLRFRVRRLNQDEPVQPKGAMACQLIQVPVSQIDVFYEQAINGLAELQYNPLEQFQSITEQLGELNLVYLHLKMGEPLREKRTGIVSATQARPSQFAPTPSETAHIVSSYAQRHYQRAQVYLQKGNLAQAVIELRDAIRLEASTSEYHALLAKVYLLQNLPGMAKVHCRQALKLNPQEPLAMQLAPRLNLASATAPPPPKEESKPSGGLFGLFARKR